MVCKTHEKMIFTAILPNGVQYRFSFAEYLAWRDHMGISLPHKQHEEMIAWLGAEDNNIGRISAWISINEWRLKELYHPTSIALLEAEMERIIQLFKNLDGET